MPAGGDRRNEVFAAWRHFFEALAERRTLVLVFEDLHWADEGLLDFVDYLADWAGDVPLLVVGTARPELLARRSGWGGGKTNAVTLSLAPLSDDDTARLIGLLLGRAVLEAGQQAVLLAHAGGNPLYAEQYVQMLAEHGADRELPLPESIQGIVGARLDLLEPPDKRLLQDAAVIGKVFWPGAVAALDGRAGHLELEEYLHVLERKQFIRRERASSLAGETQYAFAHVLLRDVAYGQIPRAVRAGKHAEAAGWIESLGRPEDQAEMLAHHYLAALELARAANQDTTDLTPRARPALQSAGDRAFALNSLAPAARYYRAALELWPEDAQKPRAGLLRLLGTVLVEAGELEQAKAALTEGAEVAAAAGLPAVQARIRVQLGEIHSLHAGPDATALAECEAATAVLDAEGDLEGLAEAWISTGKLRFWLGESPADQEAFERAIGYARQGGNLRAQMLAGSWLVSTFYLLPVPAEAAIDRAEQLLRTAKGDPWAEADILMPLSLLYAYAGRFADAREALACAQSVYGRSGAKLALAASAIEAGHMELVAGNPAAAEHDLREGYEAFRAVGERGYLSTIASLLAEALYVQGRLDEAQQMTEEAQAAASPDDIDSQARWRATRAKLLARRGQFPAARRLVSEAAALVSPTSWAVLKAQVLVAKAEVNRLAGARDQAAASLRAALRIYQDRHAAPLADQGAGLPGQPHRPPWRQAGLTPQRLEQDFSQPSSRWLNARKGRSCGTAEDIQDDLRAAARAADSALSRASSATVREVPSAAGAVLARTCLNRTAPPHRRPGVSAVRALPVTLCYQKAGRAVARVVARNSERTVHSEHSGTQVLLSVQVARPERCAGLLVMRGSGVRFPKAAQFKALISSVCSMSVDRQGRSTDMVSRLSPRRQAVTQSENWKPLLVSLLDGIPRALELATAWKAGGHRSCGQAAEATHIRSGRSFPALTADRGAVAVTEFDDSPSAGGDQQARRTQADRWIGTGGLDPGRVHDLVAALGDA